MTKKRRSYTPETKFRIALEATKGIKTIAQIAQENQVHPNLVRAWKQQLEESGSHVFETENRRPGPEKTEEQLQEQVERLQMELAWLKKRIAPFS